MISHRAMTINMIGESQPQGASIRDKAKMALLSEMFHEIAGFVREFQFELIFSI
jgi:hypothetical protein